jgi:hypothetical protein
MDWSDLDSAKVPENILARTVPLRRNPMAKAYFEQENLDALSEIFRDARKLLQARGLDSPDTRDQVARRIFELAGQGMSPRAILREIIPMSATEAGLPASSAQQAILASEDKRIAHAE